MNPSNESLHPTEIKETSKKKMLMFSTGYFFNTFVLVAFNNYVWTFYEGELGLISIFPLWPIYLAVANVVFTLWSMLSNPLLGYLTDKPMKWTKKRGFHWPWIIIGGIPTAIVFFFLFTPPNVTGVESVFPILIYYSCTVCLFDTFNSLFQTHSYGAFPAHFRGDSERIKASLFNQIFIFSANFFAIMIWSQIIIPGVPMTFAIAAFISLIFLAVSLIVFLLGARESDEMIDRFVVGYEISERVPFFGTMKMALKQKNYMLALGAYLSFTIAIGLTSMNSVNFIDDVLQEEQSIRTLGSILMLISSFLTMPLWIRVAKKIGNSKMYAIGLTICGLNFLLNSFIQNEIEFYLLSFTGGISAAMYLIVLSPVFADCYDEIAVKTGKHQESTIIGIRNFFVRITVSIQSFIIAIIHVVTVYNPKNLVHDNEALLGLRLIQGFFPFIFCVIGALVFYEWFDLKDNKKQELLQKLKEMDL